jgi:hypothetical protein
MHTARLRRRSGLSRLWFRWQDRRNNPIDAMDRAPFAAFEVVAPTVESRIAIGWESDGRAVTSVTVGCRVMDGGTVEVTTGAADTPSEFGRYVCMNNILRESIGPMTTVSLPIELRIEEATAVLEVDGSAVTFWGAASGKLWVGLGEVGPLTVNVVARDVAPESLVLAEIESTDAYDSLDDGWVETDPP